MKKIIVFSLVLVLSFLPFNRLQCQFKATEFTKKPVTNFTQRDYGDAYHNQNWSVTEDSSGILHFGNRSFVLHYNGVNWDATPTPLHGGFVTSLAADNDGNVYVGAGGEFGLLQPDEKGVLKYISLSDSLEFEDSFFGQVWKTMTYKDGVIFFAQEQMFYWEDNNITVIHPETTFHLAFVLNDKLFVRQRETGLMQYKNNELVLLPDGDIFKDYGVFGIFPVYDNNKYLIVTQEIGLYTYSFDDNDKNIKPLETPHEDILNNSRIIGGTKLHNGNVALNTLNRGVIVIDPDGYIVDIIDQNKGIRDNDVKQVYQDRWNNLWLALQTGISRVNYSSPVSFYDANTGLHGSVQYITKFNRKLYAGTSNGLFVENDNISDILYDHFVKIEGFNEDVKNLTPTTNGLLIGTPGGLYIMGHNKRIRKVSDIDASSVQQSKEKDLLFAAGEDGFYVYNLPQLSLISSYRDIRIHNPLNIAENTAAEINGTELWIGTIDMGVINLHISPGFTITHEQYFPGEAGLIDTWVQPLQYKEKVHFGVVDGLMEFIDESDSDSSDPHDNSQKRGYFSFSPIQHVDSASFHHLMFEYGKTWLCFDNKVVYIEDDGKMHKEPFLSVAFPRINHILPADSNTLWIAADDGLAKAQIDWEKDYKQKPNINLYRITSKNDSLLFKGFYHLLDHELTVLNYESNDIYFYYASQFDENGFKAKYSYKLKGYRDEWTEWSYDDRVSFTNLREGDYVFEVKARDIYGNESEAATFEFKILPPWYRTIGAYVLYVLLAILIVYGIVRLSIMRLKAKNIQLEKIIEKRTEEIRAQKEEIEKQHAIVVKQKEEITSSITYASRIQNALVPSEEFLNESLPEHFILWMPRDIVSGDFYWAKKIDPYVFIVAADCTGHGVPGAFMSMLGIAFLNEIVQSETILLSKNDDEVQAAHALEEMRKHVKTTLHQTGDRHEQKDGMDLAFCAFNTETKTMYYSGANNPLFLIRKNELIEYKPTRNPIGIHIREKSFENHKIKLEKDDIIYLFSDGYRDQFGGDGNVKFGKKAFSELLMDIHKKPLDEQKQILEKTIDDWMAGNHRQLDDILVVGFKIE